MRIKMVVVDVPLSPRVKRWALRVGVPASILLAAGIVWAMPLKSNWNNGDVLTAEWRAGDRRLQLVANLSEAVKQRPSLSWGAPIWGGPLPQALPPWSVYAGVGGA